MMTQSARNQLLSKLGRPTQILIDHVGGSIHRPVEGSSNGASFSWSNVVYEVEAKAGLLPCLSKGPQPIKTLLDNVSGFVPGGSVLAIMGPSGSGKTTLLDVLAGRVTSGRFSGDIRINGQPRNSQLLELCSYVPQEDHLMGPLTVRETLRYAGKFKINGATAAQIDARVEEVIEQLALQSCADTRVGDVFFRGISGQYPKFAVLIYQLWSMTLCRRPKASCLHGR